MTLQKRPEVRICNVQEIFGNNYQIPTFQREYSWEATNVVTLIEDLSTLVENKKEHYLLGQIVVTEQELDEGEEQRFYVVDGQQRLITLQLLAIYIWRRFERDGSPELGSKSFDMVRIVGEYGQQSLVVALSLKGNEIFQKLIGNKVLDLKSIKAESISERNLISAYETIELHFKDKGAKFISDFDLALRTRTHISKLTIGTISEAPEIFEHMNDRGLELNKSDLIKNYLFRRMSDKQYKNISDTWEGLSKKIFKLKPKKIASINFFLRAELIARTGVTQRMNDLLDNWDEYLNSKPGQVGKLNEFIKELPALAKTYSNFAVCKDPGGESLRSGKLLNFHPSAVQHFPILMAGRKLKNIDYLVSLVEQRVLFSIYTKEHPPDFEKIVPEWANSIYKLGELNPSASQEEIKRSSSVGLEIEQSIWTNKFEVNFCRLNYEEQSKKVRFVLARVSEELEKECHGDVDFQFLMNASKYEIDHIIPQSTVSDSDVDDDLKEFIHSVGNLVLIQKKKNSSMKDKTPKEKIAYYKDGLVAHMMLCSKEDLSIAVTNKKVAVGKVIDETGFNLSEWTTESIRKRTYFCMNYFAKTFKDLDPPLFAYESVEKIAVL
jgi:hypothetical protein